MVWGRKQNTPPPMPTAKPERSPDEIISEMLNAYQEHFYTQQKGYSVSYTHLTLPTNREV